MAEQSGSTHWHFRDKKVASFGFRGVINLRKPLAISHRHEGGHLVHKHMGLHGYGRTRETLKL